MTIPELPESVKDVLLNTVVRYVTAKLTTLAAYGGIWAVITAPGYVSKIGGGAGVVVLMIFDIWHSYAVKLNTVTKASDATATAIADSQSKV